ncbi:hypothetical protein L9F63_023699, partial [Diploptera punctata]
NVWAVTVGVALPLIAVLLACICCRKTVPKNELMGLAGMVKITNPEENSNHNNQNSDACTVLPCATDSTSNNANKRASTTANRSLPDIPRDSERIQLESSELYATVEENKHATEPLVSANSTDAPSVSMKRLTHEESKSSDHSSLSHTDDSFSPYARLKKENPYDKLRGISRTGSGEHPYAQVGATNSELETAPHNYTNHRTSSQNEDLHLPQPSTSSDATGNNPVPPPRTRKSSSHSSLVLLPSSEPVPDIQAATAIAGRISANQELPYMTPPIQQTNFSGDSQDSKGYTSISVREPLANLKAQTKEANRRSRTQELVDSHYATVSDDSDEVYAAIGDPGQEYTSGSETYAQIQQTTTADGTYYQPPQPPSVDSLKQVAQVHSRQASSSSATSSVANLGSPKPEKRQANSPLPPPPAAGSPELLYAPVDKAVSRNVEEMYAKVNKKKQREASEVSAASVSDPEFQSPPEVVEPSYESLGGPNSIDPEIRHQNKSLSEDCDESATEDTEQTDASYELVTNSREDCNKLDAEFPGYEKVGAAAAVKDEYAKVNKNRENHTQEDIWANLGRYECVQSKDNPNDESQQNCFNGERQSSSDDIYSGPEPDYSSISRDNTEPNYESMSSDTNYESVNCFDPPYERLHNEARDSDDTSSNYEKVNNTQWDAINEVHRSTDRSKKETAKKRHNTGRPEATDDGDKLRNCSIEEKRYEVSFKTYISEDETT